MSRQPTAQSIRNVNGLVLLSQTGHSLDTRRILQFLRSCNLRTTGGDDMAINLVSSIMQFLTPDMIAKIASALGLDRALVQKAISAGVPAILASLASLANKPGGAQQLSSALTQQQKSGMFDSVVSTLGSSQAARTGSEQGLDMMSTLMGGTGLNALTSALGSYSGISSGKSETLLGLLGSIVMGAIGQQQSKTGLDSTGLATLLSSQKDQIASALPSAFTNQLRDSGFMDTLDSNIRRSAEAMSNTARRATTDLGDAAFAASKNAATATSQGMGAWPYWVAGLAILAGLGWFIFGGGREEPQLAQRDNRLPVSRSETVGAGTPNQSLTELTGQLTNSVNGMRSTLLGITDPESAQAALPKLRQVNAELDKLNNLTLQLTPQARSTMAAHVTSAMPAFNQLCDRVLAIPGVAGIAKPLIDSMRTKLDTMARA
jgi:hypothetical protein